jgi:hypothetical protein
MQGPAGPKCSSSLPGLTCSAAGPALPQTLELTMPNKPPRRTFPYATALGVVGAVMLWPLFAGRMAYDSLYSIARLAVGLALVGAALILYLRRGTIEQAQEQPELSSSAPSAIGNTTAEQQLELSHPSSRPLLVLAALAAVLTVGGALFMLFSGEIGGMSGVPIGIGILIVAGLLIMDMLAQGRRR